MNMKLRQAGKREWFIDGCPGVVEPIGPYETKADAADDLRGMLAFYRHNPHLLPKEATT